MPPKPPNQDYHSRYTPTPQRPHLSPSSLLALVIPPKPKPQSHIPHTFIFDPRIRNLQPLPLARIQIHMRVLNIIQRILYRQRPFPVDRMLTQALVLKPVFLRVQDPAAFTHQLTRAAVVADALVDLQEVQVREAFRFPGIALEPLVVAAEVAGCPGVVAVVHAGDDVVAFFDAVLVAYGPLVDAQGLVSGEDCAVGRGLKSVCSTEGAEDEDAVCCEEG